MRFSVLAIQSHLLRGAAIAVVAGFGAGCSSDFSRFAPTSNDYTGSVNQQQIIHKRALPARQDYPADIPQAQAASPQPAYVPPVQDYQNASIGQPMYTGSVQPDGTIRSTVKRTVLAPVAGAGAALATGASNLKTKATDSMSAARKAVTPVPLSVDEEMIEPVAAVKKKVTSLDQSVTGAVDKAKPLAAAVRQPMPDIEPATTSIADKALQSAQSAAIAKAAPAAVALGGGWSLANAASVTAQEGQTLSGLASKYGVPVKVLVQANGMASADSLRSGQKILIPTYRADGAAKPAPAQTAAIKKPIEPVKLPETPKVPAPAQVAVLPNVPEVKSKTTATTLASASQSDATKSEQAGFRILSKKPAVEQKTAVQKPVEQKTTTVAGNSAKSGGYVVASGDSLYTIAKKNGTTVAALKAANGISDGKLKIGQKLKVPAAGQVVAAAAPVKAATSAKLPAVDPITTGSAATVAPKKAPVIEKLPAATPSNAVIEEAEKDTAKAPGATGISKLRWPVKGRTLTGYGQPDAGKVNDGIDISVPKGTPIKAAENGVVIYAGTGLKDFGNTVLVRHDNGLVTVYGHADGINVKRGQTVKRGEAIATTGMSGNTKVPKLHFEVRKDSKPINPATLLE